jgi:predicted enzyme related to lactoylglutathione lyase
MGAPRLLARHAVHPDDLDVQMAFHERLLGAACDVRMPLAEAGLELAMVGNVLLIASPRPPGDVARATAYTLLVASVADHLAGLEGAGVEVTEPVVTDPWGTRTRVRHPDGTLVEVIDHRPLPGE